MRSSILQVSVSIVRLKMPCATIATTFVRSGFREPVNPSEWYAPQDGRNMVRTCLCIIRKAGAVMLGGGAFTHVPFHVFSLAFRIEFIDGTMTDDLVADYFAQDLREIMYKQAVTAPDADFSKFAPVDLLRRFLRDSEILILRVLHWEKLSQQTARAARAAAANDGIYRKLLLAVEVGCITPFWFEPEGRV